MRTAGWRRVDGAEAEGAEGAGAEGPQGIEGGDDGVGVLEDEAAGGREGEHGAEGPVEGLDLDLAVAREGIGALEGEGEQRREGKVIGVGEVDVGVGVGECRLAQQGDDRARRRATSGGEDAAVAQSDVGGEVFADVGGRIRKRWPGGRSAGFRGGGVAGWVSSEASRGRGEDEVAEGELFDLAELGAGEEEGFVAGVELDGGDGGGLGEGAGGELSVVG